MASLMNNSAAVVPVPLAIMENLADFSALVSAIALLSCSDSFLLSDWFGVDDSFVKVAVE